MFRIDVFISHSWKYSEHYDKLHDWIFEDSWNSNGTPILFVDQSVPKDDPIHNAPDAAALEQAIFEKISSSDVIVIPTGMYANYSNWIQKGDRRIVPVPQAHLGSRPLGCRA